MSFRSIFLPSLLHARPNLAQAAPRAFRSFHSSPSSSQTAFQRFLRSRQQDSRTIAISRSLPSSSPNARRAISPLGLGIAAALAGTSLSLAWPSKQVRCDSPFAFSSPSSAGSLPATPSDEPKSILSLYELSFGTVCGICAGVFVKKGARAIAFLLGGMFILLQYLSSKSYISVDWARFSNRYDSSFSTKTSTGYKGPTVGGVWNRLVDFLTANFQQRASFLAGLALGLRLG